MMYGDEPSFDQIGRTIANSSFSYLSERAKGLLRLNHDRLHPRERPRLAHPSLTRRPRLRLLGRPPRPRLRRWRCVRSVRQ